MAEEEYQRERECYICGFWLKSQFKLLTAEDLLPILTLTQSLENQPLYVVLQGHNHDFISIPFYYY
jgi:hypothetical protein